MSGVQLAVVIAVAIGATVVVLVREPLRQAVVLGVYGLLLALLFFAFQAPDVALSEIVVTTVGLPLMILLAITKIREHEREQEDEE